MYISLMNTIFSSAMIVCRELVCRVAATNQQSQARWNCVHCCKWRHRHDSFWRYSRIVQLQKRHRFIMIIMVYNVCNVYFIFLFQMCHLVLRSNSFLVILNRPTRRSVTLLATGKTYSTQASKLQRNLKLTKGAYAIIHNVLNISCFIQKFSTKTYNNFCSSFTQF